MRLRMRARIQPAPTLRRARKGFHETSRLTRVTSRLGLSWFVPKERRLYLVLADKKAISYPVGVGRAGKQWQGQAEIDGAFVEPAWSPTAEIKRDNPAVPERIPGGARNNPMGARALTLSGGKYAIHGTNKPETIGTDATYGCIRMFNEDVIDLYDRASVGTKVVVIRG